MTSPNEGFVFVFITRCLVQLVGHRQGSDGILGTVDMLGTHPFQVVKHEGIIPKWIFFSGLGILGMIWYFFLTTSISLKKLFEDFVSPLFSKHLKQIEVERCGSWNTLQCPHMRRTDSYTSGCFCIHCYLHSWILDLVPLWNNIFAPCTVLLFGDRHYRQFCGILNIVLHSCSQKHLFFMAMRFFQKIREFPSSSDPVLKTRWTVHFPWLLQIFYLPFSFLGIVKFMEKGAMFILSPWFQHWSAAQFFKRKPCKYQEAQQPGKKNCCCIAMFIDIYTQVNQFSRMDSTSRNLHGFPDCLGITLLQCCVYFWRTPLYPSKEKLWPSNKNRFFHHLNIFRCLPPFFALSWHFVPAAFWKNEGDFDFVPWPKNGEIDILDAFQRMVKASAPRLPRKGTKQIRWSGEVWPLRP